MNLSIPCFKTKLLLSIICSVTSSRRVWDYSEAVNGMQEETKEAARVTKELKRLTTESKADQSELVLFQHGVTSHTKS